MSRSSAVVIAYVMKKYKMTYNEAFGVVKERRPIVRPNNGFIDQLELYETMRYQVY